MRTPFQHIRDIVIFLLVTCAVPSFADLVALDNADNEPYPLGFNPGDNAGLGFTPWVILDSGLPGAMYTTTAIDGGTHSWGINGTYALGRGFSNAFSSGIFTFLALHNPNNTTFSGFNLKTSTSAGFDADEVLRFGLDPSDGGGVFISTNAGVDYTFLDCGWVQGFGHVLSYRIVWADGAYTVSVSNLDEAVGASYSGVLASNNIAMFGMGLTGAGSSESLTFDAFQGTPVPEPSTLLFCISGLFIFSKRFLRRTVV